MTNQKKIDKLIPRAINVLESEHCGILKKDKETGKVSCDSQWRSMASSFGVAIVTGSLRAAAAEFTDDGGSNVPRSRLLCAMYYVVNGEIDICNNWIEVKKIAQIIASHSSAELGQKYLHAAVAMKYALNLFID